MLTSLLCEFLLVDSNKDLYAMCTGPNPSILRQRCSRITFLQAKDHLDEVFLDLAFEAHFQGTGITLMEVST